ncbi:hypothetical protein [Mesorhizobium sp. INR15]|uniref:hypothetical protein n=1 Tax=Mesorhizobium sp. INR15 TaxID=2654248 RepID=UPI00189647A0|nr:hypothetical protein [Mesorhizobium sp. INR15]QPC91497.1 hypothetical protein GA829_13235 [Mesorhizobium sp. INR15]
MSLEAAITENTAVMKDLLAATKDLLSLRTEAVEKVTAAVNAGKGKTDTAKTTETKVAEADKGQISTSPEDRKNPYEGIKEMIAGYVTEIDRPEEREARKEKVRNLLNHEKIKKPEVEKATAADHIKEDAVDVFKKNMEALKAKGAITQPAEAKSDDLDI